MKYNQITFYKYMASKTNSNLFEWLSNAIWLFRAPDYVNQ